MLQLRAGVLLLCLALGFSARTNENVRREIDISHNYAKHTLTVTLDDYTKPYIFALRPKQAKSLSAISAKQGEAALKVTALSETPQGIPAQQEASYWQIDLQGSTPVKIVLVLTDVLKAKPAVIDQKENQLVEYADNVYFFSPYATAEQTTVVKLASAAIEHQSRTEPTKVEGDTITYGPYKDKAAFSAAKLHIHYQNNKPFVVADSLRRTYHVSHWGVLRVEEHYKLKHVGAALRGTFSRLEYQRAPAPSSVPSVTAVLPAQATDIYFRDQIGNISTSLIREGGAVDEGKIEVDFYQRFPLFGGWQTDFYFGYNLPLDNVVTKKAGEFTFSYPEASPLKQMVVRHLETTVILPNGASPEQRITITKQNIVTPEHTEVIVVKYRHSSIALLREPLLLTTGFFAFAVFALFCLNVV